MKKPEWDDRRAKEMFVGDLEPGVYLVLLETGESRMSNKLIKN
jgi:hypothetical protein